MDELDALKLLRGDTKTVSEEAGEPKEERRREVWIYVLAAVAGFILLTGLYYMIMHPIDRARLKLAIYDSYTITTTANGRSQTIEVDGEAMFFGGQYYEIDGEDVYGFRQDEDGVWHRQKEYYPPDSTDNAWLVEVMTPQNYEREFFPWKPMEFKGSILELENVRTQVLMGKCIISGERRVFNGLFDSIYYVTIEIGAFGLTRVELPEKYIDH